MEDKLKLGLRLLLGLIYTVFGLNFFFQFIPVPPLEPAAGEFLGALFKTGYMFPLIKSLEVLGGLALLAGLFVPLSLVVLAPITVNIVALHLILDPKGWLIAVLLLVLHVALGYLYRSSYRELLKMK